jgi:hypothetical protein
MQNFKDGASGWKYRDNLLKSKKFVQNILKLQ